MNKRTKEEKTGPAPWGHVICASVEMQGSETIKARSRKGGVQGSHSQGQSGVKKPRPLTCGEKKPKTGPIVMGKDGLSGGPAHLEREGSGTEMNVTCQGTSPAWERKLESEFGMTEELVNTHEEGQENETCFNQNF